MVFVRYWNIFVRHPLVYCSYSLIASCLSTSCWRSSAFLIHVSFCLRLRCTWAVRHRLTKSERLASTFVSDVQMMYALFFLTRRSDLSISYAWKQLCSSVACRMPSLSIVQCVLISGNVCPASGGVPSSCWMMSTWRRSFFSRRTTSKSSLRVSLLSQLLSTI